MRTATRSPLTAQAIVRALGLLLLSQALFWAGMIAAENAARPSGLPLAPYVDAYAADDDGAIVPGSRPERVPIQAEPAYKLKKPNPTARTNVVFVHDFELAQAADDQALYLAWTRRIVDVRINEHMLTASSSTDLWGILGGFEPVIYPIPADYLLAGDNRLTVTASGRVAHIMPVFFIGDAQILARAHTWGRVFSIDLVIAATGILLFVLLLTLSIDWPAQDRVRVRALAILLAAWALRNLTVLDVDGWIPDPWRLFFHFMVTFAFLFALLVFAVGWTGGSRWWHAAAAATFALVTAVCLVAVSFGSRQLFHTAFGIETALSIVIGLTVIAMLLVHFARSQEKQTPEILLFLICTTVVIVDAVDDQFQITVPFMSDIPLTFYAAPMCGLLLALGMAASLAAQSTRARRAVMSINETLEQRLAEREKEIEASYARQAEYEKHKTIADERQRIVRDMHDGMGGQLVSLLMRARNNSIDRGELAGELQSTLDDLRLVVHSMNNVGSSLDTALGTFRAKIEPQLRAAGVRLEWHMALDGSANGFGPHSVLQIYRILQEACTNAMRHSGADLVRLVAERHADEGVVQISVIDNGSGPQTAARPGGHGVRNMSVRAQSLGAELTIGAGEAGRGTVVTLRIPLREAGQKRLSAVS